MILIVTSNLFGHLRVLNTSAKRDSMQLDVASTFQTDMKNDEITDGQSVVDFDSQAPRESALAYKYFELYRDAGQQRSLRSLCEHTVEGKKRSLSQIGRWSSKFSWQERVEAFDAKNAQLAFQRLSAQRKEEITTFISEDLAIALQVQNLCKKRLQELTDSGTQIDCRELRQLALAYRESRIWLMELIGFGSEGNENET